MRTWISPSVTFLSPIQTLNLASIGLTSMIALSSQSCLELYKKCLEVLQQMLICWSIDRRLLENQSLNSLKYQTTGCLK